MVQFPVRQKHGCDCFDIFKKYYLLHFNNMYLAIGTCFTITFYTSSLAQQRSTRTSLHFLEHVLGDVKRPLKQNNLVFGVGLKGIKCG